MNLIAASILFSSGVFGLHFDVTGSWVLILLGVWVAIDG
jgi:hypothetical protein